MKPSAQLYADDAAFDERLEQKLDSLIAQGSF